MTEIKATISYDPTPPRSRSGNVTILTGQTFGLLKVLALYGYSRHRTTYWLCRCDCGVFCAVPARSLISGHGKSCGCLLFRKRGRHKPSVEYLIFHAAKARCENPNHESYKNYGGRGIEFRFESFEQFLRDVGKRPSAKHSIDRKDTNGHYEVGNVKWSTSKEQNQNRRNNRLLSSGIETHPLAAWADRLGITRRRLENRLDLGWCETCTVTLPKSGRCPHRGFDD